ncbi:hypothetical protein LKL35_28630 [Streptomyces sp. ET3-23]|uniref:hypothetical protein n=1 Tax=Streptomyces sp. ET3-23 TaxID=2885643 RepID=UPI001D1062F0|nr:hypothetical protein [Streptomyces sp. ET3-23]MCC2279369.1 hypothetical protein [Streptomyces sp. ET3-23]
MPTPPHVRVAAAQAARDLHDAFRAHGCTVEVVPQPPVNGQVYLAIHDPLSGAEARLLTAALQAYRPPRCAQCRAYKHAWAEAVRTANGPAATETLRAMGVHQRQAHS